MSKYNNTDIVTALSQHIPNDCDFAVVVFSLDDDGEPCIEIISTVEADILYSSIAELAEARVETSPIIIN